MATEKYQIKATSNILNLLGNELIGSDSLAIFELVKNSYDADAESVSISFLDLNTPNQRIVIEDDGCGMTADIIHRVWLTIGTNYKKKEAKISKKFRRFSLGNKGVGRLAVHRLAESIQLETKTEEDLFGTNLEINWKDLVSSGNYIEDLFVEVRDGIHMSLPKNHGTRITLCGLKNKHWTKTLLRDLVRKIENFKSPLLPINNFDVSIICDEDKKHWIDDIKTGADILSDSLYTFNFQLTPQKNKSFVDFEWQYSFNPHSFGGLNNKQENNRQERILPVNPKFFSNKDGGNIKEKYYLRGEDLSGIGNISGQFYVFNQSKPLLDKIYGVGRNGAVKDYIKENCGIKVYRDNIRVYNYGEPSDDWLGLELAKVQRIGDHFSKKVTIGAISLNLKDSEKGLIEKTNREGFSEDETYWRFREIVRTVFSFFERVADNDKQEIEAVLKNTTVNKRVGLSETIKELEEKLAEKNLKVELSPLIRKVEKDYNDMRDVMLNSGMTGLNLALVFHEIEREMKYISADLISEEINISTLKARINNLNFLLENFSPILKQGKKTTLTASAIVNRAVQINQNRFNYHNIIFSSPLLSKESPDFKITGPGNLILSSLSNIIDNAIYWVSAQHDLLGDMHKSAIYIGTDTSSFEGPAIVIADTGKGFQLEPDMMIQPFKTTKEGGMGLGLYFVNLVMESIGGKLHFPDMNDIDIPKVYNGACIILEFPKNK
ncbi:MAG: ATP-binding protein [Prevotella sp.]|nr:ATP-binding protein [Prevotella sp.]